MNQAIKRYRTEKLNWWFVIHLPSRRPRSATPLKLEMIAGEQFREFGDSVARSAAEILSDKQLWNDVPKSRRGARLWFVAKSASDNLTQPQVSTLEAIMKAKLPEFLKGSRSRTEHDVNSAEGFGWKIHVETGDAVPETTTISIRPETPESTTETSAPTSWTEKTSDGRVEASADTVSDNLSTAGESSNSPRDSHNSPKRDFDSIISEIRSDPQLTNLVAQLIDDSKLRGLAHALCTDKELRRMNDQVLQLQKIAISNQSRPITTLKRIDRILVVIRRGLGTTLASILSQWRGQRWSIEESKQIASATNAIVKTLGLGVAAMDVDGVSKAASLHCAATGRDRAATFRLVIGKNEPNDRIRRASRDFPEIELKLEE